MKLDYKDKGKIGITFSTFDMLHAGHVVMLEEAKRYCDFLIVAVQIDPAIDRPDTKNPPVQSIIERQIQAAAVRFVDEVIVYGTEKDLEDLLLALPINIRFLGEEYRDVEYTGKRICEERSIEIHFNRRDHSFSSSRLRTQAFDAESTRRKTKIKDIE